MYFTNHTSHTHTYHCPNTTTVHLANTYKYRGLNKDVYLTRNNHVNIILASANCSFGSLKHRLKHTSSHFHKPAYTTVVRPKIEYETATWHHYRAYIVDWIESLQNRAALFIFLEYLRHSSMTDLKLRASLPINYHRRERSRLSLCHKV